MCSNDFFLSYAAIHCIGEPGELHLTYFGVYFSAWKVQHCFPPCICPGKANTAFSLGKRNNDLHIAKLLGALQKTTYTALEKAL